MKKILAAAVLTAMLLSCFCIFAFAETAAVNTVEEAAKYVATAVYGDCLIDGELDDTWKFAQINYVKNVFVDNELNDDPAQARFRVMYDEKYLYFYVEVYDISMSSYEHEIGAGNSWYNRDGVAFVFAPDGNKDETATQLKPAFWYIIRAFGSAANYNQVSQNIFVTEKEGATLADQNDFEKIPMSERMYCCKQIKDESGAYTGYVIECKVNLIQRLADCKDESGVTVPEAMTAGMEIGFDMYINDCNYLLISNSRDYGLTWGPTLNSYKNNAEKGTIKLADKSVLFNDEQGGFPEKEAEETTVETQPETTPETTPETAPETAPETEAETTAEVNPDTTAEQTAEVTPDTTKAQTETKKGCGSCAAAGLSLLCVFGASMLVRKH